jgi:guanylate kinase
MSNSRDEAAGRRGQLFIVSAPSGTGKTTLVERLVQEVPNLRMSRSYTSRAARAGEQDGVDYNFITRERFEAMVGENDFLEWADVFGNYYGTCAADTERDLATGLDVVLVIDVQGARKVRTRGIETIGIFVLPPSAAILEQRLRGRSKDSEEQIGRRLDVARREVDEFERYEYVVVNDDVDAAVERLRAIVLAERGRVRAMRTAAQDIIKTFAEGPGPLARDPRKDSLGKNTQREQV